MSIGYTPSRITLSQPIKWAVGVAITAAAYQIGRDTDSPNKLHLNVPTGASFEFSINDVAQITLSATTLTVVPTTIALGASPTISSASGNITLSPAGGTLTLNTTSIDKIVSLRGTGTQNLDIRANSSISDSVARRLNLMTLDSVGDANVVVAYAIATATGTTPIFAMRGDITVPIASILDASFLAFRWNPADDVVTVYVNDGGTIRSVAIGTVV